MEGLDKEELAGILGHEFGHIAHNDTKALLINLAGNGLFSLILFLTRIVMNIIEFIMLAISENNGTMAIFSFLGRIARLSIDVFAFLFILIGNIILSINSVRNECRADLYAYEIGYGEELKKALYVIKRISFPVKMSFIERLTATHPRIDVRIQKLEELLRDESPEFSFIR